MFNTMLKRNGKDGHPCHISNLRGKSIIGSVEHDTHRELENGIYCHFGGNKFHLYLFLMNFGIQDCCILNILSVFTEVST